MNLTNLSITAFWKSYPHRYPKGKLISIFLRGPLGTHWKDGQYNNYNSHLISFKSQIGSSHNCM